MTDVTNRQVADFLKEFGVLLELNGDNPFRVRAHANAARTVESLEVEVEALVAQETLTDARGIGKGLAELITEFVRTGTAVAYRELRASTPPGLLDILRIQGLGPKKVRAIRQQLGIDCLERLEQACTSGDLSQVSGFGKKTQENILKGIESLRKYQGQHLLDVATETCSALCASLREHPQLLRVTPAGSLRRRLELVERIDLVASTEHPAAIADHFAKHPAVNEVSLRTQDCIVVRLEDGLQAHLHLVPDDRFAAALHHLTGSEEYLTRIRERAEGLGFDLGATGLLQNAVPLPCAEERDLFTALDLPCIPPELREGQGEVEAAIQGTLPRLIDADDIRGMLHVHSTYSDGVASLEEMALAVRERGYAYLGMADHSRSAFYASGLQEEDVRRQHEEIDTLNERLDDFRIFKGIESDILADGALDYDDPLLESFDFTVISIHSRFGMDAEEMTRRIVRAIEHPASTILGHLTGRLLLEREGYGLDIDAVLDAAARHRVAVEINAHPRRLDIDWRHLRRASELGVRIAVNTDAHRISGFDHLRYGIDMARKGWLRPDGVINALDAESIAAYFRNEA